MSDTWEMDYDEAANHWLEKDRGTVHMEPAALREKINAFLRAHNTGALATAGGDLVHCTPIEYNYVDSCLYLFSEGGLKFKCLKHCLYFLPLPHGEPLKQPCNFLLENWHFLFENFNNLRLNCNKAMSNFLTMQFKLI